MRCVDLFAGPGGWDHGIEPLGIRPIGIEWDDAACETRRARGLVTLQADVSELDPAEFEAELLIGSPPCQAFSAAGKGDGQKDVPAIMRTARALGEGRDIRGEVETVDPRSLLVVEPLRWALALKPNYIACEQVPPVLMLWQAFAEILRGHGYSCWAGVLTAEAYGVPQTRERAFLMASRVGSVFPPEPTHQTYVYGQPAAEQHTLTGTLKPWVSMAEALGWGFTARPVGTITAGGSRQGGSAPLDGGSGSRETLRREREAGRWVQRERSGERAEEGFNPAEMPSQALTSKTRSWTVHYDRRQGNTRPDGTRVMVRQIPIDEPAPTIGSAGLSTGRDVWVVRDGRSEDFAREPRSIDEPAATLGSTARQWVHERPATTIAGDSRVFQPGGHHEPGQQSQNATRVSVDEASILQGFPPDYPWQGSRTKQFEQIGNAVPPPLARAVIESLMELKTLKVAA